MGNEGQNPSSRWKAIHVIITGVFGSVLSGSKRTGFDSSYADGLLG
jgi:hypothetical protein